MTLVKDKFVDLAFDLIDEKRENGNSSQFDLGCVIFSKNTILSKSTNYFGGHDSVHAEEGAILRFAREFGIFDVLTSVLEGRLKSESCLLPEKKLYFKEDIYNSSTKNSRRKYDRMFKTM